MIHENLVTFHFPPWTRPMPSITGVSINPTCFVAGSSVSELAALGMNRPSCHPTIRELKNLPHNQRKSAILRAEVQRGMTTERIRNAMAYARYIRGVATGSIVGGTPAVTLFIDSPCTVKDGALQIPYGAAVIAIDGETQLEARFMLAEDGGDDSADWKFPVHIFHSCDHSVAKQYLVDVNTFGVKMSTRDASALDQTGRLTGVVRDALRTLQLEDKVINHNRPRPATKQLISRTQLWAGIVGFLTGKPMTSRGLGVVAEEFNNPLAKSKEYEFGHDAAVFAAVKLIELAKSNPETRDKLADAWSAIGASYASSSLNVAS